MNHDRINMPAAVRQELDELLDAIKRATTFDQAERNGVRAEGVVLGVERLKARKEKPDQFLGAVPDIHTPVLSLWSTTPGA